MHLEIKQNTVGRETISSSVLDKLYELSQGTNLDNTSDVIGWVKTTATYLDVIDFLLTKFPNLTIDTDGVYIRFADPAVEEVLRLSMGKDEGEGVTVQEAANTVANYFQNNTDIESFDELKYFKTPSDFRYPYNFQGCTALKSIDITGKDDRVNCNSNTSIEYFYGIDGLKGFLSTYHTGTNFTGCGGITTLELTCTSDMVTNAYRGMAGLLTLIWKVSSGVNVGSYSFYGTPLLERVIVDDLDSFWTHNMGWGSGSPFQNKIAKLIVNDTEVTSVTVPQTITQIQTGNWRGARLTSCTFHSNITLIGNYAFEGCNLLVIPDLNLPNLTTLGSYAFQETKVQTITDLGSVASISDGCFKNCSQLTSISIPSSLTSIGNSAFEGCSMLQSITIPNTVPPTLGTKVFDNTNNCPIYVPAGSVSTYQSASGWSTYASRIQAIPT